jgi:LysR family cys regulon transcriptional activator
LCASGASNFNLTEAAKALFIPARSFKAIIELEEAGHRYFYPSRQADSWPDRTRRAVLKSVELIMQEIDGLKRIGKEYAAQDSGSFTIATTHTQARYALPKVIHAFMQKYPKVRLSLLQGIRVRLQIW